MKEEKGRRGSERRRRSDTNENKYEYCEIRIRREEKKKRYTKEERRRRRYRTKPREEYDDII